MWYDPPLSFLTSSHDMVSWGDAAHACTGLLLVLVGLHEAALFLLSIFVSHRPTHHQATRNGSTREGRGASIHSLLILGPNTKTNTLIWLIFTVFEGGSP